MPLPRMTSQAASTLAAFSSTTFWTAALSGGRNSQEKPILELQAAPGEAASMVPINATSLWPAVTVATPCCHALGGPRATPSEPEVSTVNLRGFILRFFTLKVRAPVSESSKVRNSTPSPSFSLVSAPFTVGFGGFGGTAPVVGGGFTSSATVSGLEHTMPDPGGRSLRVAPFLALGTAFFSTTAGPAPFSAVSGPALVAPPSAKYFAQKSFTSAGFSLRSALSSGVKTGSTLPVR
mmetsp:Transcript_49493/g.112345  ORF Transcript_49493/g.112345 Transcript_49493/m.112345 type:complete len:236 (-) Transcript_49493:112-819(-)